MTPLATQTAHDSGSSGNGRSTLHDLFALTDEQILDIEAETQDVGISESDDTAGLLAPASSRPDLDGAGRDAGATNEPLSATSHESPVTSHAAAEPPPWLAERMADPRSGADARDLWNGVQQSRQEAAAFREVFAKPEDARAAAQRARLLDDIDRAYFAGDATQRASLAASMLREDPAAFREMVFAGLRALEETGKPGSASPASSGVASASPSPADAHASAGAEHSSRATAREPNRANDAHLAAYSAFERAANEDLERAVGGAIERTLDQALPHGNRSENAPMRGRLAATVRQDIEKALQGDRQLGEQVSQILSSRRLDNDVRAQVVRVIGERAQQLVPGAAKRVLSEWTQTTLASHRGRTSRIDAAAARKDVEAASPEPRGASATANSVRSARSTPSQTRRQDPSGSNSTRKVDYRKVSDQQILDL